MSIKTVAIASAKDIPVEFGPYKLGVKKTTVQLRDVKPEGETFVKPWGTLEAKQVEDVILIQDSGDEYPIKRSIFDETYEGVGNGRFRKTEKAKIVLVPEGYICQVQSKEGLLEVPAGDYLAVGKVQEVWANKASWVQDNLDIVGTEDR